MANAFNQCHFVGKIPVSDKIRYEFHEATNDKGTNARMNGCISVQRDRKPEGEQYYPEDLIPFVAWGKSAEFMEKYVKRGSVIALSGSLEVSTTEDDEGNRRTYYSVIADNVRFVPRGLDVESSDDEEDEDEEEEKPKKKDKGNPFQGKKTSSSSSSSKKANPFSKKK